MTVRRVANGEPPEPTTFELAMRLLFPVMVASPFATTVLSMIGISKIRASRGSLVGLPAAVGLSLLYPLLVLDAFLVFAVFSLVSVWLTPSGDYASQIAAIQLTTLLMVPVLDALIIYLAWRSASRLSVG